MEDISKYIKAQREAKKVTLEQLSKETLISVSVLKDIENGRFDKYNGDEPYVKMYLKKIAGYLDLDAVEITQNYIELTQQMSAKKIAEEKEKNDNKIDQNTTLIGKVGDLFQDIKEEAKYQKRNLSHVSRKSVYEDHYIRRYLKYGAVFLLCAMIVGVIWYALLASKGDTSPEFSNQPNTQIEGVDPTVPQEDTKDDKKDPEPTQEEEPKGSLSVNQTNGYTYEVSGIKENDKVTIEVTFGGRGLFNFWIDDGSSGGYKQIENAYNVYEQGDTYTYEVTFNKDVRYAFNFWNLTDAEIKINDTVVEYDPSTVSMNDGASTIVINLKGGSVNEPTE